MKINPEDPQSLNKDNPESIAAKAKGLMNSLPDEVSISRSFSAPEAKFLSAARDFATKCSRVVTWSESEARTQIESSNKVEVYGSEVIALMASKDDPTKPKSCSAQCRDELDFCRQGCKSYICFLDCRMTYVACIADCLINISSEDKGDTHIDIGDIGGVHHQ